jgi:hypothetical protein
VWRASSLRKEPCCDRAQRRGEPARPCGATKCARRCPFSLRPSPKSPSSVQLTDIAACTGLHHRGKQDLAPVRQQQPVLQNRQSPSRCPVATNKLKAMINCHVATPTPQFPAASRIFHDVRRDNHRDWQLGVLCTSPLQSTICSCDGPYRSSSFWGVRDNDRSKNGDRGA